MRKINRGNPVSMGRKSKDGARKSRHSFWGLTDITEGVTGKGSLTAERKEYRGEQGKPKHRK